MIAENSDSRESAIDNAISKPSTNGHKPSAEVWAQMFGDPANPEQQKIDDDIEQFWEARSELERLRQFARARRVAPWAVFGTALARAIATIPPHVVLPPTVGSYASLNLFVALVAESGYGKGGAEKVAADALETETFVFVATPGSGEGIPKLYAYKKRVRGQEPQQVNLRNAAMLSVAEIDTFAGLISRGGSTLMPELRKAWMGEQLGFWWSDAEKRVTIMEHRYRMTMVVGVQPGRGGAILNDSDGGTPQRFIWLWTTDPNAPDDPPEEPEPLQLPPWPGSGEPEPELNEDGSLKVKFQPDNDYRLHEPADKAGFHVLELPPSVVEAIQREQLAKLRGEVEKSKALDSHAMLAQLKVAAALMWMNGRTDKVNEEDWGLAGVVMKVSNATRAEVQKALSAKLVDANIARALSEGQRVGVVDDMKRDKAIKRVANGCVKWLQREDNGKFVNVLMKRFSNDDKQHVWPALEWLEKEKKVIELKPAKYNGQDGHTVHLRSRQ